MKRSIVLAIMLMLQSALAWGQGLAYQDTKAVTAAYLLQRAPEDKVRFHMCQESKVGFGVTAVGIITGCVGIEIYSANSHSSSPRNDIATTGAAIWLVGGVVGILGSVLCIDGSNHDLHRFYKEYKLSIVSDQANRVGIAYNF